jgi:hypothetical protein
MAVIRNGEDRAKTRSNVCDVHGLSFNLVTAAEASSDKVFLVFTVKNMRIES